MIKYTAKIKSMIGNQTDSSFSVVYVSQRNQSDGSSSELIIDDKPTYCNQSRGFLLPRTFRIDPVINDLFQIAKFLFHPQRISLHLFL